MPALEGSEVDPITNEDDLPDCSTDWQLYTDFPNGRCLSKAGINQYTREQFHQPPVFGTAIGLFGKDPRWVCKAIEGDLVAYGVSVWYKDPQCWKSSINFAIGSIKPGVCTEGIKHVYGVPLSRWRSQ